MNQKCLKIRCKILFLDRIKYNLIEMAKLFIFYVLKEPLSLRLYIFIHLLQRRHVFLVEGDCFF